LPLKSSVVTLGALSWCANRFQIVLILGRQGKAIGMDERRHNGGRICIVFHSQRMAQFMGQYNQ
jgi:hypothetical protein